MVFKIISECQKIKLGKIYKNINLYFQKSAYFDEMTF